jgi:hypothetical protein
VPICEPCHPRHTAQQCEDTTAGRTGVERRCYCQHTPRTTTTEARIAPTAGSPEHPGGTSEWTTP